MSKENQETETTAASKALPSSSGYVPTNIERLERAKDCLEAAAKEMYEVHATGEIDLKRTAILASAFTRAHDAKEELTKTFLT